MTQLPHHMLLPHSDDDEDDDDSCDVDESLGAEEILGGDGDGMVETAMDQERRKRNREAARKVRMKKNRRHEDVKQEFLDMSAKNVRLKYEVSQEEKHLEKWIKLAEKHKAVCPDFNYTIPGKAPLILRSFSMATVTTTTDTATFQSSGSTRTFVSESTARQVNVQPKKVVRKLQNIIDIMSMNEGDIFTTEGNTSAECFHGNRGEVDTTPNWSLCVTSTEVGPITMDTNTPAIYSTGVAGVTAIQQRNYSNMMHTPVQCNNTVTITSNRSKTNILAEKLDSILNNVGEAATNVPASAYYTEPLSSNAMEFTAQPHSIPEVTTSYIMASSDPATTNIYDMLSIAEPQSSSGVFSMQPPANTFQGGELSVTYEILASEPPVMSVSPCVPPASQTSSLVPPVPNAFKIPQAPPPVVPTKTLLTQQNETTKPVMYSMVHRPPPKPAQQSVSAQEPSIIPDWDILEPSQTAVAEKPGAGKRTVSRTNRGSNRKRGNDVSATRGSSPHHKGIEQTDHGLFQVNVGETHGTNTMTSSQEAEAAINNIKAQLILGSPQEGGMMALLNSNSYVPTTFGELGWMQ